MLEDGEIAFESFYIPGEFEVHPAIGRSAFMVRPDGVRLHRFTDAEWDMEALLPPDNESSLNGAKEIPLKEKNWNHYRVKVAGNTLTLIAC